MHRPWIQPPVVLRPTARARAPALGSNRKGRERRKASMARKGFIHRVTRSHATTLYYATHTTTAPTMGARAANASGGP